MATESMQRSASGTAGVRWWRRRGAIVSILLAAAVCAYYVIGSLVAYTGDAYMRSDLVAVAPEVTGIVQSIPIRDNQAVRAGDLLALIDPAPFQLDVDLKTQQVASLEAAVAVKLQAQAANAAEIDAANAALTYAQKEFDRTRALSTDQFESQAVLDRATDALRSARDTLTARQAEAQVAEREVLAAKAQVSVAQANLAVVQYALARTRLVAPVDGYINNLSLRPGSFAKGGEPVIGIVDGSHWRIIANFKEDVAASAVPGTRAWVWLDSDPWRLHAGRVESVGRGIAREPGEQTLLPYVAPTTDWIRLRRRLPVTVVLDPPMPARGLYMGADARVVFFR